MAYTPKPGSFSLFRNDRKERDTHPDYRGDGVLPDGTPAWISAWLKEANGKKFFSISIQPKEARQDDFRGGGGGVQGGGDRGFSGGDRRSLSEPDFDGDSIPFAHSNSIW